MAAKSVLITGGSDGIGLATARLFASNGWRVAITGRDPKKLQKAAQETGAEGIAFNVADRKAVDRFAKEHRKFLEGLDVLVNNAGFALGVEPVQEGDPDDWDQMVDVNVKGLLYLTRAVLPHMISRGGGHVINLGSTAGHGTYPGGTVYCATKHAERAITGGLRHDLLGTGVRVSSVDPGFVETNFSVVRYKGDRAQAKKVYEGFTPLASQDVAEAIWWVAQRPPHVNIQEVLILPTDQAWLGAVHRRPR